MRKEEVKLISKNIIDDIKYRNPIDEVISSYVTLTRTGANMKGLCPFHSEKTPSFTVFGQSSSFYCFGCGAGGDVITFIMKAENLDYAGALEFLAKRAGITIPDSKDDAFWNKGVSRSRVIEMNTCAARFFRDMLFDEKIGGPARAYIAKRQLSLPIVKRFGLGYAPDSFNALRDHLRKNGYTDEEMTVGFLCGVSKKNGNLYDYFRHRLMFPLIDVAGNIVAFGGRALDEKAEAGRKYINTSDTPAFKKSKMLFGLNYAKNNCSERIILCEGNIDVISLHEAGFENAVATLGTAITPDHARLLKRYTERVAIAYDGDSAGQRATQKAVKILDEAGIDTKVINITGAKDPDEYIKKYGKESFRKLIEGSRSKIDYIIDTVTAKYDLDNAQDKIKAARELCEYAATIYYKVEQDLFVMKAAKALEVDSQSLANDVAIIKGKNRKASAKKMHDEVVRTSSGISDRINRDFAKNPKAARLEELVLGMMLFCPEFIKKAVGGGKLSAQDFVTDYGKRLFAVLESVGDGEFDISMLNETMTPDEVARAVKMSVARMELQNTDEIFFETVESLKDETKKLKSTDDGSEDADDVDDITARIMKKREGEDKK